MNVSHCTVQLPTFLERNARSHVQAEPPSMSPHAAHHTRHARADLSTSQQQPSAHTQRDKTTTVAIGPELAPPRPLQRTHAPPPHTHARRWPRFHAPSHTVTNRSHFMSTCNEHESHSRPHQTPPHAHQRQPLSILSAQRPRPPHTIHTTHSSHSLSLTHIVACCIRTYRT